MIEKIYFAKDLVNPTYVTYCTALHDAMAADADFSKWFDFSDVDNRGTFIVTLKNTLVSFVVQFSEAWAFIGRFTDFTGAGSSSNSSYFYHHLNTEIGLYKIVTKNTIAFQFESDTTDEKCLTVFTKITNIDDGTDNMLVLCVNSGYRMQYFSESIGYTEYYGSDRNTHFDKLVCAPWIPKSTPFIAKDIFRYDGGKSMSSFVTGGFYDINGDVFLMMSRSCNFLIKCD